MTVSKVCYTDNRIIKAEADLPRKKTNMAENTPGATPPSTLPNGNTVPPVAPTTPPTTPGTPPQPPENAGKAFIPSELSDEDFGKIFEDERLWKHDRFKQLNERAKQADKFEAEKKAADEKAMQEQGKWKELAEKKEAEANEARTKLEQAITNNKIIVEAAKLGVVDNEAVLALISRTGIKVNDKGEIEGVVEALTALLESKPYLKGTASQPTLGGGTNPGNPGNTAPKKFKASQIKDVAFYRENEKDILQAMKLGLIENDLQ